MSNSPADLSRLVSIWMLCVRCCIKTTLVRTFPWLQVGPGPRNAGDAMGRSGFSAPGSFPDLIFHISVVDRYILEKWGCSKAGSVSFFFFEICGFSAYLGLSQDLKYKSIPKVKLLIGQMIINHPFFVAKFETAPISPIHMICTDIRYGAKLSTHPIHGSILQINKFVGPLHHMTLTRIPLFV